MRVRSIILVRPLASLEPALASEADAVAVTVADSRHEITALRLAAAEAIAQAREAGKLAFAIVNHPRTRLLRDDLAATVMPGLAGVILPHTVEPQDVRDLAVLLREYELAREIDPGTVAVFPVMDTARGVLRASEIAVAAPRIAGLVFDGFGYAADVGAREEEHGDRLAFARGAVVAAARAADALPLVRANAFELQQLGHYGFAGALIESVAGATPANLAFTPTEAEVVRARAIIGAYSGARGEGGWAARLGTEVVEADSARRARQLLAQAGVTEEQ